MLRLEDEEREGDGEMTPNDTTGQSNGQTGAREARSVVVVELSVPSDAFTVGSVLHVDEGVHVELAQFVPIGDSFIPYIWVDADDADVFAETVRADHRIESLTEVGTNGENRTLFKVAWGEVDDAFLSTVADHGLVVENAAVTDGQWTFQLQGPDRENLSSFRDTLRERDVPVTVHRVWSPEVSNKDRYGLTDKQRETLELAFERGYFEVPRDVSLTDLSEVLEVSHQSVSRRVRGGLSNLLANTLMNDSDAERPDR